MVRRMFRIKTFERDRQSCIMYIAPAAVFLFFLYYDLTPYSCFTIIIVIMIIILIPVLQVLNNALHGRRSTNLIID